MRKSFARLLVVLCAYLTVATAHAGEFNATFVSVHFKDNNEMNNFNPGIGYTFDSSFIDRLFGWKPTGFDTVGVYYNSVNRVSLYYGYYLPIGLPDSWRQQSQFLQDVEVGVMVGLATGYNNRVGIMPAALLIGSYPIGKLWGDNHWSMRVSVVPAPGGVVTLSASYRF